MIVIASAGDRFIHKNIEYIYKYNKKEKVLVIDNLGRSKDYSDIIKEKYRDLNIKFIDSDNLREWGSWWKAFSTHSQEGYYCFIHDSMFLKQSISKYVPQSSYEIFAFSVREGWVGDHYRHHNFSKDFIKKYKISNSNTSDFYLIFGSMFIAKKNTLKRLKNAGFFKFHAKNRAEACISERLLGIIFKHMGITVKYFTNKTPKGKNNKGMANSSNPVKTENELYIKIRSGRSYK